MRSSEEGFEQSLRDRHALGFQTWQRFFRRWKSRKGQAGNADAANSAPSLDAAGSYVSSSLLAPAFAASPASIETAAAGSISQLAGHERTGTHRFGASSLTAALTAAERNPPPAAAEPPVSNTFAVLDTAPSANLSADASSANRIVDLVGGSAPLEYLPVAMPIPLSVAGGAATSIARRNFSDQALAACSQLGGQLPGSGLTGGADFVSTGANGSSAARSAIRCCCGMSPLWQTGTGRCRAAEKPAAGTMTGQIGILSGRSPPRSLLRANPQSVADGFTEPSSG